MIALSLRGIAHALGGDVVGGQVNAPGPNHRKQSDRSLSVKLSASSPDGFIVHSFAGDSFQECRDYVKARLGLAQFEPAPARAHEPSPGDDETRRIERARKHWSESVDPRGTIVETYLRSRALDLPNEVAVAAIRFHAACPWLEGDNIIRVPAMIAAMRSIAGDDLIGVHRTRLSRDGAKLDRRMRGTANGVAIKIDGDDTVTTGLAVGEGVETCLAARQLGLRPVWALGSKNQIAKFPVLYGIESLTILAEPDAEADVQACAERWHAAGREVLINRPTRGKDLNDAIRGAA